ncbi:NADH-quinone oxidoreductase subunit NuoF [Metallumcola ferriviriculae]|uniref:NADH-quinone oxidoreductase subunit NuoF n=1 Tax=Metallumcola ferriviriculae TaxID=3039180 RepID=A0AAU0UUC6_9FIRM|nr:NADH-quinone oxidoreductase subunit NuoF [Desulfitibacteraceae bacterium MK1]
MENLMSACCSKCTHDQSDPCKDYLLCRTEGPICHDSEECRAKRQALIDKVHLSAEKSNRRVLICAGTGCVASGSRDVQQVMLQAVKDAGITDCEVSITGCHGFCEQGPIVIVEPEGVFYGGVSADDVEEIVEKHLKNGELVERLFFTEPNSGDKDKYYRDIMFYKKQERMVLKNCGHINPEKIDEYIVTGGYSGLIKTFTDFTSQKVVEEVKTSGLRGRGGGGFPTGLKWQFTAQAQGDVKYVVCNADEGDPGAFMDRSILEGNPHAVIEGMMIAGYAVGATEGYVYVRAEYPLAIKRLERAIAQAEEYGILGGNVLGSGFSFKLKIKAGAGAFVCGEETALLNSIQGERGMPRVRPPFPANEGLWYKPTLLNNVETYANIPIIMEKGGDWYASRGTEKSKGTKVFALTGKINNTGLAEVPMGITLREIIFDIGGGIKDGKKYKAVQIGGPSGGCLPEEQLDLPIDYDSLISAGAMMGSGGLVVMDETTCMVDLARYFLTFTQNESCGKCVPCREGTKRMLEILTRITEGDGQEGDIETLERLAKSIKNTSLCGLGQTAPNPVLSTLRYFRNEYEAHINKKWCPAGECKALTVLKIDPEKCNGCTRCARNCPVEAITGEVKQVHEIDPEICTNCGTCIENCRKEAIYKG